MAVTIYDEPQAIAPAGNPMVFTFSSDQTAQANFSFVVELYINGTLRLTQEVFRQFNTLGRIDVSEAVQSTLSSPLVVDGSLTTYYDPAINGYYIKVYEKYGTPTTTHGSDTSNQRTGFNGALRHQNWINFDYQDYNASTTNSLTPNVLFLTDWPRTRRFFCGEDERLFLGILCSDTSVNVRFRLKNSAGSIIANALTSITLSKLLVVDASPSTIIANTSITQANFDSAAYYEVIVRGAGAGSYNGSSETFTIYLDRECKRYETRRLHWLNKYGVWDSFTFPLVSIDSTNVEKYDYQKEKGVWENNSYTYPLYQGEKIHYTKTASDQLILNSDWLHQDVQQWLMRSLLESPSVYLEISAEALFGCECLSISFTFNEEFYSLTIEQTGTFNDKPLYDFTVDGRTFRLMWVAGEWKFFELNVQTLATLESTANCPFGSYEEFGEKGVDDLIIKPCGVPSFEPVKVINPSYQFKTRRRDGLIQEQITIERTYTYRSQIN